MQTRDQKYASDAYIRVSQIAKEGRKTSYGSMAHKLPVLIRSAGLAQGLAFVESREKQLLTDLAFTVGYGSVEELLSQSRQADLHEYIHLTKQVLDALLWYKRFAQSVLGIQASDEEPK